MVKRGTNALCINTNNKIAQMWKTNMENLEPELVKHAISVEKIDTI